MGIGACLARDSAGTSTYTTFTLIYNDLTKSEALYP
jgi:hypothetical protein